MYVIANEPSLALYRLQEHVRKSLPFMVEKRSEVLRLHEQLQGRCYDVDYAVRYKRLCSIHCSLFTALLYLTVLSTESLKRKIHSTTAKSR